MLFKPLYKVKRIEGKEKLTVFPPEDAKKIITVAFADDDPNVRLLIKTALGNQIFDEGHAYQLILYSDGKPLINDMPKMVNGTVTITDREMKTDGYVVLKAARRYNHLGPLFMVSGGSNQEHVQKAFDLGVSHYFHKPIDIVNFQSTLYSKITQSKGKAKL